jgi:hypothetical protein
MIDNPFWDFSLALYAKEGVADACLLLQDKLGYDVNLLLLDIELECERAEQDFLLSRLATNFETGSASGNVDTLATAMGVNLDASDRSGLDCILSAAADFAS